MGLIYCAGLPDISNKKIIKNKKNESVIETEEENCDVEEVTICKNCGYQIFENEAKCSNCGQKK